MSSSPQPVKRSRPRRNPLSCQMCRLKKLKCDRQRPCSNCRTRRMSCSFNPELPTTTTPALVEDGSVTELQAQNEALKARVARLEHAVFAESDSVKAGSSTRTFDTGDDSVTSGGASRHQRAGLDSGETWRLSEPFQVAIRTAEELVRDAMQPPQSRAILLPTRDVAMACLDLFETHLDAVQAITHMPSVRKMTEGVYTGLQAGQSVAPGPAALILAICSSLGSWEVSWDFLVAESETAFKISALLTRQALCALENVRVTSRISIEAVQASMLLTFNLCQHEGMSPHTRLLHSSAVTMARELGLHKADLVSTDRPALSRSQIIDMEVQRKVWWHLASTDWLFAYNGGPYEGAYSVHPQHMAVNKPRNINHDDLSNENTAFVRQVDEPTVMSFHLERIKIATICREVMDGLWGVSTVPNPEQMPYEKVAALDVKFRQLIDGLPSHLRVESNSTSGNENRWQLAVQRATINLMIHARRCKLHLPFLVHFKSDPRYDISRNICLESAHKVFQARRRVESEASCQGFKAFLKLGGQLSHTFYAAFVLVMDLCVNKADDGREQMAEVRDAIQVMEEAKDSSRIASSCYETLIDILRKHQVNMPAPGRGTDTGLTQTLVEAGSTSGRAVPESTTTPSMPSLGNDEMMLDAGNAFEDVWQDYMDNGASLDPGNWEVLIKDLGMHIV